MKKYRLLVQTFFLILGCLIFITACHRAQVEDGQNDQEQVLGGMRGGIWVYAPANILSGADTSPPTERKVLPEVEKLNAKSYEQIKEGRWVETIRYANMAIRISPEFPATYINRSVAYIEKGLYDNAIEDCRTAIDLIEKDPCSKAPDKCGVGKLIDQERAAAFHNMGLAYDRQGLSVNAGQWYSKACDLKRKESCKSLKDINKMADQLIDESASQFAGQNYPKVVEETGQAIALNPGAAIAYINRSGALANLDQLEPAVEDAEKAVSLEPDNGLAYNNLGVVCEGQGDLSKARLNFEMGCQMGNELACQNYARLSEETSDWYEKSRLGLKTGNWHEAIRTASAAIRINPNDIQAYVNRSWGYIELGLYDDAIADCKKAISLSPDLPFAYNNMGLAYQRQRDFVPAAAAYRQACEFGDPTGCSNAAQIPKWIETLQQESVTAFNERRFEEANNIATQVIGIAPENLAAYTTRAGALAYLGKLDEAFADIERAISLDPDHGMAYNNKGYIYELKADLAKAKLNYEMSCRLGLDFGCQNTIRLVSAAIQANPQDAKAYNDRARAFVELERYEEATADCEKALALASELGPAYTNLGLIQDRQENYVQAVQYYQKACENGDQEGCVNEGAAYSSIALTFEGQRDFVQAAGYYQEACELGNAKGCAGKEQIPAWITRLLDESVAAFNDEKYEEANKAATQVITLDSKNAASYITRAGALIYLGRIDEAISDCEKAILLSPDHCMAYNNRGYAYELKGDMANAVYNYDQSCDMGCERACENLARTEGR